MNIAVMLILIDNFDEVLDTVEEIRKPVLVALIDRKIGVLARDLGAILRKFEKDRFLLVMESKELERLKERRFDICSQVREMEMGNSLPVTLSVGVGAGGESFAQTMEHAQAALDLALGRGGDQALVKDADGYLFYGDKDGGAASERPSNERVKARIKLYALNELIDAARNVLVMGHKRMDMDSLGAAVGLFKLASHRGRECRILLNEVTFGINAVYEALIRDEAYVSAFVGEDEALAGMTADTLVVIVDTNRPAIVESHAVLGAAKNLVVIDHHRLAQDFITDAVLTYQEPFASSTCELLCEMMQHVKEPLRLKSVEADALLSGMTIDTKYFTQKTGAKTFEAAAYLRRAGADPIRIKTYLQENLVDIRASARAVADAWMVMDRFMISVCKGADTAVQASARAADELMNVAGIDASFVLTPLAPDKTHISARSLGKTNVQLLMERLGGGGHLTIAAATVDADLDMAVDMVTGVLNESD